MRRTIEKGDRVRVRAGFVGAGTVFTVTEAYPGQVRGRCYGPVRTEEVERIVHRSQACRIYGAHEECRGETTLGFRCECDCHETLDRDTESRR